MRQLGIPLPAQANFADYLVPFALDEATYQPGPPVDRVAEPWTFRGYRRPGARGVGTRNLVVILGTTSRTASVARQLAARLQPLARLHAALDGIVAVAHTEGGGPGEPNNAEDVLRALAGFMVHPNVGAVVALDLGVEPITNARLRAYMVAHGYALGDVPHAFLSVGGGLAAGLAEGEAAVRRLVPAAVQARRTRPAAQRPAHRAPVRRVGRVLRRLRQSARRRDRARGDPPRRRRRPVRDRRSRRRRGLRDAQHDGPRHRHARCSGTSPDSPSGCRGTA